MSKKIMLAAAALAAAVCHAQPVEPVIYPAKGQTAAQMEKDRSECNQWARQQSGYDPSTTAGKAPAIAGAPSASAMQPPALPGLPPPPGPPAPKAGPLDTAENAAAPVGMQARAYATWLRAVAACMEGHGYAVR